MVERISGVPRSPTIESIFDCALAATEVRRRAAPAGALQMANVFFMVVFSLLILILLPDEFESNLGRVSKSQTCG